MTPGQILLIAKIGAVGLLIALVFGMGHRVGKNGVQAAWDSDKAQRIAATAALVEEHGKEITALRLKQDAVNLKVSDDHEIALQIMAKTYDERIAAVRASGGLRVTRSICAGPVGTTTETASTGRRDADTAGTVQLPTEIEQNLFSEARRADEIVEQVRSCQNWIRSQGFYGDQIRPE